MDGRLTVLWEDPHGLAVAKPAGVLTQRARKDTGEVTLEDLIRAYLAPDDPNSVYLGTVHRLDRPVSGVILWAKNPRAARRWSEQFALRQVSKEYWAVVEGDVDQMTASGRWEDWIVPPDELGRARLVPVDTPSSVRASTTYEIGRKQKLPEGLTWLKLRPETGRTHQLRCQVAGRGIPIVGDQTYGALRPFRVGIALHARALSFDHPIRRQAMTVEAPLPESWEGWIVA
ncbi:RluA family pseudouridine synthase [Tundrisphaera lichenicola]|uniref:RluA family pseudouridine synthase n=1 Tax=Tundrisphaera lichenicola TaxID=2029860 RepID=UPI003EB8E02D